MRGRGQDRGRGRGRGRGREERNNGRPHVDVVTEQLKPAPSLEPKAETEPTATTKVDTTRASGLVGYTTDASAAEVDESDSGSSSDSSSSSDEDDEPAKPAPRPTQTPASKSDRPICKFFARTGRCKMGQKCRFQHIVCQLACPR